MNRTSSVIAALGAALALGPSVAQAQDLSGTLDLQAKPPVAAPPADAKAPAIQGQVQPISPQKLERIYHIRQIEAMLSNAVRAGASTFATQMQAELGTLFVTSTVRARGHELEDYGIFFDVDVPTLLPSALWAMQMRQQQLEDLYSLRNAIADPKTNENLRRVAQLEARKLERALGLVSQQGAGDGPQAAPRGVAMAATTDATMVPALPARSEVAPVQPMGSDPLEMYTEAIKSKLIDAMLSYGSALRLDDSEWLTIAARSSDVAPGQLDDSASVLLRIKGADLNAYLLKKITREEVIKKIEIKIG